MLNETNTMKLKEFLLKDKKYPLRWEKFLLKNKIIVSRKEINNFYFNIKFKKCVIRGISFYNVDLSDCIFEDCYFINCKFYECKIFEEMKSCMFEYCKFISMGGHTHTDSALFYRCDFMYSSITFKTFSNMTFAENFLSSTLLNVDNFQHKEIEELLFRENRFFSSALFKKGELVDVENNENDNLCRISELNWFVKEEEDNFEGFLFNKVRIENYKKQIEDLKSNLNKK